MTFPYLLMILISGLFPVAGFGAVDLILLSGNPGLMTISTATAGSNPNSVTDASTSYSVSTLLLVTRKITAQVDSTMATGLTLAVQLQAPIGGTSLGFVNLGTSPSDVVTGVQVAVLQVGLTITYRLSATVTAAPGSSSRVVTFTLL